MKAARIYQRVSTEEQNLERQNALIEKAKTEGYYIAGVYKEKASVNRIREKGAFLAIPGIIDLSQIQTDSDIAKIVLDSIQTMLLKIALQMARDDYEQRKKRQAAGIAEAKKKGRFKGRQADTQKHKLIISLRSHHTLQETAKLAGCSVSLVKLVMRQHKQSLISEKE